MNNNDPDQAIDNCAQAISRDPNDALVYYRWSMAYTACCEWDMVIADFAGAYGGFPRVALFR